jgi:hypothetical protein
VTDVRTGSAKAGPGDTLLIPAGVMAVKLLNPKRITLDGQQVGRYPYTADEGRRMKNGGKEPLMLNLVYSVPSTAQ